MKTKFTFLKRLNRKLTIIISLIFFAISANAQYCSFSANASFGDNIGDFYTSGAIQDISNLGSGSSTSGYGDFTATHEVQAELGSTININVQTGGSYSQGFAIWVDWNGDQDFADAGEAVWSSASSSTSLFTGTITVPATANIGSTRMRVMSGYGCVPSDPCSTCNTYGEAEDYTFTITYGKLLPFTESFDNSTLSSDWTNTSTSGGPWEIGNYSTNSPGYDNRVNENTGNGGYYTWIDFSSTDVGVILESPKFDVSSNSNIILEFYEFSYYSYTSSYANYLYIETFNGTTWDGVYTIQQNDPSWVLHSINLTSNTYNGGNNLKFRFRAESHGSTYDYYNDILIDDINLYEPKPNDAGISNIFALNATGNQTVKAVIENFGTAALTSATINWDVDGTPQTAYSYTGNLATGASDTITLGSYNFSSGNQTITVTSSNPNASVDGDPSNDSYSLTQTYVTPVNLAYYDDFETFSSDWNVVDGAPGLSSLNHTGSYSLNLLAGTDNGTIELICNAAQNPQLSFYYLIDYYYYNDFEVEIMEASSHSWQNIHTFTGGYSDDDIWINQIIDLAAYDTESGIFKIRFIGITSSSYYDDILIDDLSLEPVYSVDAGISGMNTIDVSGNSPIKAEIKNYGTDSLFNADIYYSVMGATPVGPYAWTGGLAQGETESGIYLGSYNFAASDTLVEIWTDNPNGQTDQFTDNDTLPASVDIVTDAGALAVDNSSIEYGSSPVNVFISNFGTDTIKSATIGWSVDGAVQSSYSWTGSLAAGEGAGPFNLGTYNFDAGNHTLKVWTESPNSITDDDATNDTIVENYYFYLDVGISHIEQVNTPGLSPINVKIQNYGNIPLTTASIAFSYNGNTGTTYSWAGNLNPGDETALINIGNGTFNYGSNTIQAQTALPNGELNDNNSGNDQNTITFDILADIGVVEGWLPQDNCGRGNDTLKLAVKNFGTEVMDDNFSITYVNLNSGATITENITGASILPGDTLWHTFSTPVNLAVSDKDSTFYLKGYTTYSLDGTNTNDTLSGSVESWYTPNAPIASGTSVAYGNSANLTAALDANGDSLKWYDDANTFLDYGSSYTTQPLYDTTTFYVTSETYGINNVNSDITSGTGTSTTYYVPFYMSSTGSSFKYSKYAGLYNASDLIADGASAGNINNLAFYKTSSCGYTYSDATCNIYIKQVSDASVTSSDWNTLISGATHCYSSTNQNINTYAGWQEFNFSTPFNWDGSSNILIMVEWHRPNAHTCSYPNWQYTSVSSTRAKRQAGSSSSNTLNYSTSYLPNIKFNLDAQVSTALCESTPTPVTVDVTNIPSDAGIVEIEEVTETGMQDVNVTLTNFTSVVLDSVQIDYEVNGTPGTTYNWYGNLGKNDSAMVTIGSANLIYGMNTIKAWTNLPNGATDPDGTNDTTLISFNIYSDIEVVEVTSPETYCNMGNESVMVKFANVGIDTIAAFDANYLVAGAASTITESVTTTLAPNDTMTYTFSALVDMTVTNKDSVFLIDVFADNLASDNNQMNDTIHYSVLSPITPSAPVAINDTINYGNPANLKALSVHNVFWYDAAIGGNKIAGPDTMFTTAPLFDTITYYAEASTGIADLKFTEITQYHGYGAGATSPAPSWLSGDDFVEITNLGTSPADLTGYVYKRFYSSGITYNLPSISLPAGQTLVLATYGASSPSPANYFYIADNSSVASSTQTGHVLYDPLGDIVDVVALNGFTFTTASGVTAADWSGSIGSSSGKAGVSRMTSDNNNASDWGIASIDFTNQTIGDMNPGFSVQGFPCSSSRIPVTAIVKNFPAKDAGVVKVNQPVDGPGKNNAEQLNITVKNYGTVSIDTIPVAFEFDGNAAVVDTVFATLNPGDTANFTFASTLDMHLTGIYDLITYTSLDGDNTTNNDTVVESIIHSDYCISRANSSNYEDIGNITIKHPYTGVELLNNGVALPVTNNPLATKVYSDYTNLAATNLQQGQSFTVDIAAISGFSYIYSGLDVNVYIDLNQDGTLDPTTENVYSGVISGTSAPITSGDMVIPPTAKTGQTRMRVVLDRYSSAQPCGYYSYGETEDYTVNILPMVWADAGSNDTICNTHSTTLIASGNGTYEWSTTETTTSITVSPTTETMYYLTVTDSYDYEAVDSVSVYVHDLPILDFPTMTAVCVDAAPVALNATPTGGFYSGPGISGTSFDPTVAGSGTHTLKYTYTNANGCTDSITQTILVNPLPVITFSTMADVCVDASTFALTSATPTGGTYSGPGVDGSGNFTAANAGVGTHYIKYAYTDGNGCYNIDSTTITVLALPIVTASCTPNPVNYGTTANLDVSVSGTSTYTYAWSPADSLNNPADVNLQSPATKQLTKPTMFTVTVTDQTTGCSNTDNVNATITGGPLSATPISFRDTICMGDTTKLFAQATGGSESYTYSWTSTPAGFTSTDPNPQVTVNGTTTYHVTVDDGFNNITESVTVETWALPTVNTNFNDTAICYGDSALIGGYFTGEKPFTFTKTDGTNMAVVTNYNAFVMQEYVHPTDTTTYMITDITDGNGCYNTSNLGIQVDIHPLPTLSILEDSVENCFGDSTQINISLTGQSPWMMYTNKPGSTDTFPSNVSSTPYMPYAYDNNVGDNYYEVTKVVDAYGCTNVHQDTILIRTWDLPTASILEDSIALCFKDSMQINLNFTGPSPWNVQITDGTDTMNEAVSSSLWQPWVEEEAPGFDNYYIIEVEDAHGCKNYNQDSINVETWALPQPDFTGLDAEYCNETMYDTLTPTLLGGFFTGPGMTANVFNPGAVSGGFNHDITYTYTDANGCTNDTTKSTLVRALPTVSFTGLATDYCIDAASVTLTPSPTGGVFTGTGMTGSTFDPATAGAGTHTITYTFTDAYGCTNTYSQSVTVNDLPVVSISGITTSGYCIDAATFAITGSPMGGTFTGTGIDASGNFNPSTAGAGTHLITYTYTDANGCTNIAIDSVTVHPLPNIIINNSTAYCLNSPYDTLMPTPSGGTFIGMGMYGNTFKPDIAGVGTHTITYMVTDMNGCFDTKDTIITVNPIPNANFSGLATSYCDNDSAGVTLAGTPTGGLFAGNGINGSSFRADQAGTGIHQISYTVTNAFGCSDTKTRTTEVLPAPVVSFSGLLATYCSNDMATSLTGTPAGGTFSGNGIMTNAFDPTVAGAGNHTITYAFTATNGCTSTADASTTVNAAPVVELSGLAAEHCISDTAELLTGIPSGGTFSGAGVYANYFHADSVSAGNNMVTYSYTDANGCSGTDTDTSMVYDMPVTNLGMDTTICVGDTIMLDAGTIGTLYSWTTGDTNAYINFVGSTNTNIGVNVVNGLCSVTDSVMVNVSEPMVDLGPDSVICHDDSVTLTATAGYTAYLWSNGETSNSITVDSLAFGIGTHLITVVVTDSLGCTATDSVLVTINNCIGIHEFAGSNTFNIYPNPTKGIFNVEIQGIDDDRIELCIYNYNGQKIVCESIERNFKNGYFKTFDLSKQPKGVYLIRITGDTTQKVKRIIIQ